MCCGTAPCESPEACAARSATVSLETSEVIRSFLPCELLLMPPDGESPRPNVGAPLSRRGQVAIATMLNLPNSGNAIEETVANAIALPPTWQAMTPGETHRRTRLQPSEDEGQQAEWEAVRSRFCESCPDTEGFAVANIYRIGNPMKYRQYQLLKLEMAQRLDGSGANEMQLFHGCSHEVCEKVDHSGFNRSFSDVAAHGTGVYFARDARYSASM
jgi:hypothetical protein